MKIFVRKKINIRNLSRGTMFYDHLMQHTLLHIRLSSDQIIFLNNLKPLIKWWDPLLLFGKVS